MNVDRNFPNFISIDVIFLIFLLDLDSIPEAVRRYGRCMRIKETGDDEAWRTVLFERQLTLNKKPEGGSFKVLID